VTIRDHYVKEKQRFLKNCTLCGLCAEGCPILPYTNVSEISSQDIQKRVFDFMESGTPNQLAYTKAFACMECFKCTAGMCPEDLNPMLVNELIKSQYISKGLANKAYGDARQPDSAHRILASVQISGAEYNRITTSSGKQSARYLFFPGCNVYFQPEKILNAMDIMDAIGDDYAFLPGLDYCCGDSLLFLGEIKEGIKRAEELVAAIASFQPEAAVLWCPTCHCRFDKSIAPAMDIPFKILSFPQYLAANMNKLPLTRASAGTVTLHEACKSAYTGVDRDGPREVLRQLPGVTLREMEHHGPETVCCGSGAICWFPESCAQIRKKRLQDAAQTRAGQLVTVCHYCNQTFAAEGGKYDFSVTNYVNLVAEAMGIRRDDKFMQYTQWGNLDLILKDADDCIGESPLDSERIIEVLKAVFTR
jgi:heterodisulfide reductase subunit D